MTLLVSIIAFVLLLSILVILHELGHFTAAKLFRVDVEEFGFGLPPRARTLFTRGGTRFSLNWIPFGGFVRLKGENAETDEERMAHGSFGTASPVGKFIILTAGVLMNLLLALVILTLGFSIGKWVPTYFTFADLEAASSRGEITFVPGVLIERVASDGTASQAGVPAQSLLLMVDGQNIALPSQVAPLQQGKRQVTYTLLTGDTLQTEKTITVPVKDGMSGIVLTGVPRQLSAPAHSLPTAFLLAVREAGVVTQQTFLGLTLLVQSLAKTGSVPQGITGIVGIAQLTYDTVQEGIAPYLRLIALLSINLAVLNIIPFPALDGGRLVFVLIEAILRRPANRKFELTTNAIGFLCLIALIAIITYYDVLRLLFPAH